MQNRVNTINDAKVKVKEVKAEAEVKAREVGDDVASALSKFAIFAFIGMILGAVSASFGAILAARKRLTVVEQQRISRTSI